MGVIVVGYDGSDHARTALEKALEIASAMGDDVVVAFGYEVSRLGGEVQDYAKALQERAEEIVAHAKHQAEAKGVSVEGVAIERAPAQALADLAQERGAKMIVIGTIGEHPITEALLGSTAHRLLHVSKVPVLVVPVT